MPNLRETFELLHQNWRKNHRHHSGIRSVARCSYNTWRLRHAEGLPQVQPSGVDCVTFSVVPNLTALWAKVMRDINFGGNARIWIGDCSGGFGPTHHFADGIHADPLINYLHGWKLDLFFRKYVRSEFFVISDDDVFFLDQTPWQWAMEQFAQDDRVAVVSLVPRMRFQWDLNGQKYQPMGSYCLVIRRDAWLREGLSFEAVPEPSPSTGSYMGLYDTCDFANVELIKRGYKVVIAPAEIREHLAVFHGISGHILRIQKEPEEGYAKAFETWPRQILETCEVAKTLKPMIASVAAAGHAADLANPDLLARAERELVPLLPPEQLAQVQAEVASLGDKVRATLARAGVSNDVASRQ